MATWSDDDDERDHAWEAGRKAGHAGLPGKICPFADGSEQSDAWWYGWTETAGYRAIEEGAVAKRGGQPETACPYSSGAQLADAWLTGWHRARSTDDDGEVQG